MAAISRRYVDLALAKADFSEVARLAIDETSRARGRGYVTLAADAERHAVLFVTEGREAEAIRRLAEDLRAHGADIDAIDSVGIDMSPASSRAAPRVFPMPGSPSTSSM